MITSNYKRKLILILTFITGSTLQLQSANAEDWTKDPRSATQISKRKGKIVSTETLDWHSDKKNIPKGWVKLNNKYFSVLHPNCFDIEAEGGEDDPKIAPAVAFIRSKTCKGYNDELGHYNQLNIGIESGLASHPELGSVAESNVLLRQKAKINGVDAILFALVLDANDGDATGTLPQLRWKIYLVCGKNILSITSDFQRGDKSLQRIEKSDYAFPEDFQEIASTFRCK